MRRYILLLAIPLLFASCEEEIDLTLDDPEPELVIEGYMADLDFYLPTEDLNCGGEIVTVDTIELLAAIAQTFNIDSIETIADYFPFNKVRLTTTAGYFSNSATPTVSNAVVRLYKDGNLVETLAEDASEVGTYRITHDPEVGAEYHVEVEALGNTYETMPEPYLETSPILLTEALYDPDPFFSDSAAYYLSINTYEIPGIGDNYRWMVFVNGKYQDDPDDISIATDDGIDGACVPGSDIYGDPIDLGDTIVVLQSRISQRHYSFISSIQSQTAFVGSPFDTPPAPIVGNVKNVTKNTDAYGYFLPAAVSFGAAVVPDTIPN